MAISADALGVRLDIRTGSDIAIDAIKALAVTMPEWIPRNGSPEVIYLEALSNVAGGIVGTADVVLGTTVESVLATLYGVPRLPGAGATGNLTLTFDAATSTTIPTGTSFLLRDWGIGLSSTEDVTISSATSATIPVVTDEATAEVNGLGSDAAVDLLDDIEHAESVVIAGTLAGGAAPESDSEYLTRAANRLARVTSSLVVPDHFSAYVLEDGRASNAACVPAWDGADTDTIGDDAGHVTVACYGRGGQVSSSDRAELETTMAAQTAAGITVHVDEADVTTVPVTVTVHALDGWETVDVRDSVGGVLSTYLAAETWEFGETVRTTTLISKVAGAEGVDYVDTLAAPAADVTLLANGIAQAGTLTITVL